MKDVISFYMKEVANYPLLTAEEEKKLAELSLKGDKAARNKLISSNLRFVIREAKKWEGRGLSPEDLIEEGNLGLVIAASKFDPSKNVRFISYAVFWIKQSFRKAVYESSRDVKIPVGNRKALEDSKWNMISLNKSYCGEQEGGELGDIIEDFRLVSQEDEVLAECLRDDLMKSFKVLTPLERKVILLRYGLSSEEPKSLKEIGERLDFCKERIRQIENRALTKMLVPVSSMGYAA